MKKRFLPGLTTTPRSDYLDKIVEIDVLGLKEIALFPTAIDYDQRRILYGLLENTGLEKIPAVHLRDDMRKEELEYLESRFDAKIFNIHSKHDFHAFPGFDEKLGRFRKQTYVENTHIVPDHDELEIYGGICVDFSHWQDGLLFSGEDYGKRMIKAMTDFPVGYGHISGVGKQLTITRDVSDPKIIYRNYSKHHLDHLDELEYVKKFIENLPEITALELENSFAEQLLFKDHLEKIIALDRIGQNK